VSLLTVEVAVALPVSGTFTYTVPDDLHDRIGVGSRVIVPFGSRRVSGVVMASGEAGDRQGLKAVAALAGEERLSESLLHTLRWVSDYYGSTWGEAFRAALPPTLRRPQKRRAASAAAPLVPPDRPPELTQAQRAVVDTVVAALQAGAYKSFLLYGVTGSGKSEVYVRAAEAALLQGRTVLVLVPEIALTPQLGERFAARFGDQVAVLHSALSPARRAAEWLRLRRGEARIALGARSAVFAPVERVGLVVVDEEHDASYKQQEGIRYHARDAALVRAQAESAVAILGSATPSLDSYQRSREGRHTLLRLPERVTLRSLPEVRIVDLRVNPTGGKLLSPALHAALQQTVAAGRQAILLVNRRGFATSVVCPGCGHAMECRDCSVGLVWHRSRRVLLCHWCGRAERLPPLCPRCGERELLTLGFGTERLEDTVKSELPGARVARLDSDTASALSRTLAEVRAGRIDVLVGSQMVAKGHDFPGVTLVGVVLADMGLHLPDFRASERVFQMLTQAAGRAGRGDDAGSVIIQTYAPEHPAVAFAARQDYEGFFAVEARSRAELAYPPFGHLVLVRLEGRSESAVARAARDLCARLGRGQVQVLGPSPAPVARARGLSRWQVGLKAPRRELLRPLVAELRVQALPGGVRLRLDVDPLSLV